MQEYTPKTSPMTQKAFNSMDDEGKDFFRSLVVTKAEIDKNTSISHKEYGDIVITPGNYILTSRSGEKTGITPVDFESRYKPLDINID